ALVNFLKGEVLPTFFIRDQASKFTCSEYLSSHEDLTTDLKASFIILVNQDILVCCLSPSRGKALWDFVPPYWDTIFSLVPDKGVTEGSSNFIMNNFDAISKSSHLEKELARILRVPCQGVCVFTPDWPNTSLPNGVDSNPDIYPPPYEDFALIRDALFYERSLGKTRKVKGNVTSLIRNKDHPNVCLCYMLYCLSIENPFNLAYYISKRMESVTKSDIMALPYGMLLTRLFEHVRTSRPFAITNDHYLVDHVMTHLSERRVFKIMPKERRPHPQTPTPTESSELPSPTPH
ncbi:hypothetical protein Tco_0393584, partial [Tanacetum coccineum]